jgi:hypothetical protein
VGSTVRLAAGRAVVSSGVAALVKGVLVNMLVKKLKTSVVVLLAVTVLGAGGLFRGAGWMEAQAGDDARARNPLDALRHENELLKLNLHVLLEKVHAQEAELQALKLPQGVRLQSQGVRIQGGIANVVPDTNATINLEVDATAKPQTYSIVPKADVILRTQPATADGPKANYILRT